MNKQYYQSRTGFITQSALIAALYVVLTMIVAPIAFGPDPVQGLRSIMCAAVLFNQCSSRCYYWLLPC